MFDCGCGQGRLVPLRCAPNHSHSIPSKPARQMASFPFGFSLPTTNAESNNVAELLQQQIQQGMQAFMLMQQRFSEGNSMGSVGGSSSSIFPDYVEAPVWNWNLMQIQGNFRQEVQAVQQNNETGEDNEAGEQKIEEVRDSSDQNQNEIEVLENESKAPAIVHQPPPMLDKRWEFVSTVPCFTQFEKLRCEHQVSRNRTFAYGIRYSCTQKTQMRSNCPYLLVCIFADGAGEFTPPGVGKITVYSRNKHTHPVKTIKKRQPRQKQAKKVEEPIKIENNEEMVKVEELEEIQILKNPEKCEPKQEASNPVKQDQSDLFAVLTELSRHFAETEQK